MGQIPWLIGWSFFLVLTNRWLSWQEGIELLLADDVIAYSHIAEAAPAMPAIPLSFHHLQRFVAPYGVGLLAHMTSLPISVWFRSLAYGGLVTIVIVMHRLVSGLRLTRSDYAVTMGLLILNPYLLRYYLILPGMLPDVFFITGLALILWGLVDECPGWVLVGLVIAAIGRQTTLMIGPGILVWVLLGWESRSRLTQLGMAIAIILLPISLYLYTAQVVERFAILSLQSISMGSLVMGLFQWVGSAAFGWRGLAEHCLRLAIPLLPISTLLAVITRYHQPTMPNAGLTRHAPPNHELGPARPSKIIACGLITLGIIAQPFLAGPAITGQNATRLATLGLLPMVVAFALRLKQHHLFTASSTPFARAIMVGSMVAGSFHHLYTTPSLPNAVSFSILQLSCVVVMVSISWFTLQRQKSPRGEESLR